MKQIPFYSLIFVGILLTLSLKSQNINHSELNVKIESLIPTTVNDTTPGFVLAIIKEYSIIEKMVGSRFI